MTKREHNFAFSRFGTRSCTMRLLRATQSFNCTPFFQKLMRSKSANELKHPAWINENRIFFPHGKARSYRFLMSIDVFSVRSNRHMFHSPHNVVKFKNGLRQSDISKNSMEDEIMLPPIRYSKSFLIQVAHTASVLHGH